MEAKHEMEHNSETKKQVQVEEIDWEDAYPR